MTAPPEAKRPAVTSFRTKLLVAMMVVVSGITALGLYFAQRNAAAAVERDLERDFRSELASLHNTQEVRNSALAQRCRSLVQKPRLHAALEDNALDLLYPSAKDELRDLMQSPMDANAEPPNPALHASFYRFLDSKGAVIPPPNTEDVGRLWPEEEAQLRLPRLLETKQTGYLLRRGASANDIIDEIIALPITSTETGDVIAALVLGFKPVEVAGRRSGTGMKSGIWVNGALHLPTLPKHSQFVLTREMTRAVAQPEGDENSLTVNLEGTPHLLFFKRLNPESLFPPAYEVCVYPLREMLSRQQRLRWQIIGAGVLLLFAAFVASHIFSARLSKPVEQLAVDSEVNRAQRRRAEAALASTSEELQRSTRFSANASHQLKTPVTVLRAGLEELLGREDFPPQVYDELSALLHQTYRITGVIEDLLLLSRMDAGRLQIEFEPLDLRTLVEEWLDDLSALPDELDLDIETDLPRNLHICGEKRYTTLIVQNLLENARKYNRPGGRIRVSARKEAGMVVLNVGNTGRGIPPAVQGQIFERFYRGAAGETVAGHGLGLNLARELARFHGGDLRLARSEEDWTEFEVRLRVAEEPAIASAAVA